MKKNSFTEAIYKNAGYLVVALISAVYIAGSLINISRSGRSIYEILGTGVLSLIVGIMINGVFRSIGLRKGDEDERTVATSALHAKAVEEITPYIDRLDSFCERESRLAKRAVRTRILAYEGMKYSDYFDGDDCLLAGVEAPKDKRKRRVYFKALRTKIKPLLSSNLTSDGANASNPFDFGKSKREYASTKSASDVAVKLIMAIVFGYFGVSLTGEINIASFIWNTLQIVLYVAGGVIQMYSSFSWVVDDYRAGVIKKIDMLQKFKALALAQATQE